MYWRLVHLGAHFGDTVHGHNFYTEPYVIGVRNGYYIIDISKTILMLRSALRFIRNTSFLGGRTVMYYHTGFQFEILTIFLQNLSKLLPLSFLYQRWIPGAISNYYSCFYDLLNEVQDLNWIDERRRVSFLSMFLRILYFTTIDLPVDTTVEDQYILSLSYWRAIVFIRHFKNYYGLPDSAVCVDASYSTKICQEFSSIGIPVVAPLNTRSNLWYVSYPVMSNNSSVLLCLFYFSIFSSAIREGRRLKYTNFARRSVPNEQKACNDSFLKERLSLTTHRNSRKRDISPRYSIKRGHQSFSERVNLRNEKVNKKKVGFTKEAGFKIYESLKKFFLKKPLKK